MDSIPVSPTTGLRIPKSGRRRDDAGGPYIAAKRIEALSEPDRALWATAYYAGLRGGELEALQDEDVDFDAKTITVRLSWDKCEGFIEPKSGELNPSTGRKERTIPMCATLELALESRQQQRGGFFFGSADRPFDIDAARSRAEKAWKAAGLPRVTLHQCRHSFRSYLDAIPEISETRADRYTGHSTKTMRTRYTHTLDGQLAKDAAALDKFLADEYLTGLSASRPESQPEPSRDTEQA